ncbi:unnamed protein product [Phaeothamnion confervicola]
MPIDTWKVTMQVQGGRGLDALRQKMGRSGPSVLYHGATAAGAGSIIGFFPWFQTHNWLEERLPRQPPGRRLHNTLRNAFVGFASSMASAVTSNAFHVLKVYRQSHAEAVSYADAVRDIVNKSGVRGLLGRGLAPRLAGSCLNGLLFNVVWKEIDAAMIAAADEDERSGGRDEGRVDVKAELRCHPSYSLNA